MIEREQIFDFLVDLNQKYDQVCSQILDKEPIPSIRESFDHVSGEKGQKSVLFFEL